MKILNHIKALFVKKICCGDKSCNRYWGCVNNCDLGAKKCLMRKRSVKGNNNAGKAVK